MNIPAKPRAISANAREYQKRKADRRARKRIIRYKDEARKRIRAIAVKTCLINVGPVSLLKNTGNSETDKPNSYIEVKQSLFMLSGGPEFVFRIPASMVKPYAGLDLLISMISGETTFNGVSRVSSGTYSMSSATRIGIGIGAGVESASGKSTRLPSA